MSRVCPNCGHNLKDYDNFFCSSCGNKLTAELIKLGVSFENKKVKPKESVKVKPKISLHFTRKLYFVALIFVVVIIYLGFFIVSSMTSPLPDYSSLPITQPEKQYQNELDFNLNLKNRLFGTDEIYKYVPFEADFILEGFNLSSAFSNFSGIGLENDFLTNLLGRGDLHYIVFGKDSEENPQLTLVVTPLTDDLSDSLSKIENENWQLKQIDSALIITNEEEIFTEIEKTTKNISKNISHHPKFSGYKVLLPKDGQLLYMGFTESFEEIVDFIRIFKPTVKVETILGEINTMQYNKFVIRKK